MKDVRFRINHPIHGELDAHVSLHPKTGATIHEYGHGGETVNHEDAHGDHEGGINEHMQHQIKAHAMKLGAGDHREKSAPLHLQKEEACEGMEEGMDKSEKSPREVAIALLTKVADLAKKEMDDTSDEGEDHKVDEVHEHDEDPEADDKKPKEQSKDNLEKSEEDGWKHTKSFGGKLQGEYSHKTYGKVIHTGVHGDRGDLWHATEHGDHKPMHAHKSKEEAMAHLKRLHESKAKKSSKLKEFVSTRKKK